jgi:Rieske Fe-S protein
MAICATCGNDYDKAFTVTWVDGHSATFDSIECAAMKLAPTCAHCGCRVLGHGVEADAKIYCCAHCARQAGSSGVNDRFPAPVGATPGTP